MKHQIIAIAFLLSVLGSWLLQSHYYSGDMVVHTQYIKQFDDRGLYTNDYSNKYLIPQKNSSLYYPLVAFITNVMPFDLNTDFRILHFIYLNIFFLGLLLISLELAGSLWIGIVWVLLLMTKVHIGGAAIETIEVDLVPRAVSAALIAWTYLFYLKKRHKPQILLVIASLVIHALTGVYGIYFYIQKYFSLLIRKKSNKGIASIILAGFMLIFFAFSVNKMNTKWLEILRFRNSYAFLDLWSVVDWRNLFFLLTPGIVGIYWLPKSWQNVKNLYKFLIGGSLIVTNVHIIFAFLRPQWLVIILQLGRIWLFPVYISLLLGAGIVAEIIKNNKLKSFVLPIFVVLIILYMKSKNYNGRESWIEVQKWAKSNSDVTCVFLTPFYSTGFRVESERAIVGDIKDGTLSFYSEDFAIEWKKRYDKLHSWESLSSDALEELQKDYGFHFIVTLKPKKYTMPLLFENESYSVYKIASNKSCQ